MACMLDDTQTDEQAQQGHLILIWSLLCGWRANAGYTLERVSEWNGLHHVYRRQRVIVKNINIHIKPCTHHVL